MLFTGQRCGKIHTIAGGIVCFNENLNNLVAEDTEWDETIYHVSPVKNQLRQHQWTNLNYYKYSELDTSF